MKKALVLIFVLLMAICALTACGEHQHNFDEWKVLKQAICTENGEKARYCSCGEKQTDILPATGHNYVNGTCANCGDVQESPECKHENLDILATKAPTCTEAGLTEGIICLDCDKTIKRQETVNALGHDEHTYTEKDENCKLFTVIACERSDCDYIRRIDIGKAEHNFGEWSTTKKPTCTEDGVKTRYCDCGEKQSDTIPVLEHNYENGACTTCGDKSPTSDDYFIFSENIDGTYSVEAKDIYNMPTEIVIPKTYNGNAVTYISFRAFMGCDSLTSVVIPDSVTVIGYEAFEGCDSLTSVVIPDSVVDIHVGVFYHCNKLISIDVDNDNEFYKSIDGNLYSKDGKTLVQYAYGKRDTSFAIPYSVTEIGYGAFYGYSNLTSVVIPDSVTVIGYEAFEGCYNLTSVVIPNSVTRIGEEAFEGCDSLTSVVIGDGVTEIGYGAFEGCDSLTSVVIPDSVTNIGDCAFRGCYNLISVVIGDGVTVIGYEAFRGCYNLTSIVIPNSVTNIGEGAFYNCRRLADITVGSGNANYKSIDGNLYSKDGKIIIQYAIGKTDINFTIPDGVTSIGYGAFWSCDSLTSVVIPDGVTSIGKEAFYNCDSLTSIVIPDGVTRIGKEAFYLCDSLTSIVIPNSVTNIGEGAFRACGSLTSITVGSGNANYKSIDGNLYSKDGKIIIQYAIGKTDINFTIPDGVTNIGEGAFLSCRSLTSVVIPDGVTSIGEDAFWSCRSLTSVVIPDGVTSIGEDAFWSCHSLTSVVIPNSVTSIGERAFYQCESLYKVINNSNLEFTFGSTGNGEIAYYSKILVDKNGNKTYNNTDTVEYFETDDNFLFEVKNSKYTLIAYVGTKNTVTLPNDINGNTYDIYYMRGVVNVIIPHGVTRIGKEAFSSCYSLTSVVIPNSVTSIGSEAFWCCINLTSVVIPDSVTSIAHEAFENCYRLTSVVIPDSVISIGYSAFDGCDSLTNITVGSGNANYKSIDGNLYSKDGKIIIQYAIGKTDINFTIPDGVTVIGYSAFSYCSSLTSIVIPDSVIRIDEYAFLSCDSLTSVVIPDGVTSIGYCAFGGCDSLTSVVIPDSVISIGYSAFGDCDSLTSITVGSGNANFKSIDGNLYSKDGKIIIQYAIGKTDINFTIPDGVTSIGYGAFWSCDSLTSVVIPDGVTSIGEDAFWSCHSLTSIVIPNGVTSIGEDAFWSCHSLTSVVIPDSVISIGDSAFANLYGLNVYYTGSEEEWKAIIGSDDYYITRATIHYNFVPEE